MLHYNVRCAHNGSPVARLREMYVTGDHHSIPAEAARLREQGGLTPVQELIVDVNLAMGNFERGAITFAEAREQFEDIMGRARELTNGPLQSVYLAELQFLLIHEADKAGKTELRDALLEGFFDEVDPRNVHALTEFLIIHGVLVYRQGNLELALAYFRAARMLFAGDDDPCGQEVAARYVAKLCAELGLHEDARQTLAVVGLSEDTVPMRDLLRVPVI